MLKKRMAVPSRRPPLDDACVDRHFSRRSFLKRSGLTATALVALGASP